MKIKLLIFLPVFLLIFSSTPVFADEPFSDLILIIDVSGTKRTTDPNREALNAAAYLIDMLPEGARVGVIGFSGRIEYLLPLQSGYGLPRQVLEFEYRGFTDIGLAIRRAAEMINTADRLINPVVILLTDGFISISPSVTNRTAEDSFDDALYDLGVPVHVVGVGEVNYGLLQLIGEVHIANYPSQLSEIISSIYTSHVIYTHLQDLLTTPEPIEYDEEYHEEYHEEPDEAYYEEHEYHEDYHEEPEEEYHPSPNRHNILIGLALISAISAAVTVLRLVKAVT